MDEEPGSWARVGIPYPASGLADHELAVMAPLRLTFHVTRLNMPLATRENLIQLRHEA
jgi:maleate cis-trans isomerase